MSFQEVLGLNNARFIGFNNYKRLFDEHFFNALKTNTIYTAVTLLVMIPIPVLFAVFLLFLFNQRAFISGLSTGGVKG